MLKETKHNWERSDMENFDKVYGRGTFALAYNQSLNTQVFPYRLLVLAKW